LIFDSQKSVVCDRSCRPLACEVLALLKSANSICTLFAYPLSWRSHFFVIQTRISYQPEKLQLVWESNINRMGLYRSWPNPSIWLSTIPFIHRWTLSAFITINCRIQLSSVFLYRPKPKSKYLSYPPHHFWSSFFLLDVCSSIAEINNQASFSIFPNQPKPKSEISFFSFAPLMLTRLLLDVSLSWMLDSKLQEPRNVRSKLSHNG